MGCFDTLLIPCPSCGKVRHEQSKAGSCILVDYSIDEAPANILADLSGTVFICKRCAANFKIQFPVRATVERCTYLDDDDDV